MIYTEEDKTKIYEEYSPKVLAYIKSKISDYYLAEDLCANVFVKVYKNLDSFDDKKASISTWIYTIARNTLTDYFRVRHVHGEIDESIPMVETGFEEIYKEETLDELANALEQLPERERDLVIMHYYHNLSLKEIASKLKMSYSNTKLVHNKALVLLRGYMPEA